MTPETEVDFLTSYIRSLAEETRLDSRGRRYGFDHIIYELALSENLAPVRLSFFVEARASCPFRKRKPSMELIKHLFRAMANECSFSY